MKYVACRGLHGRIHNNLAQKPEKARLFERPSVNLKLILKWIF
jgi:hypothetical protein